MVASPYQMGLRGRFSARTLLAKGNASHVVY
jgi:hypothetical protein